MKMIVRILLSLLAVLAHLTTVVLVGLKFGGTISWSWWVCLSPSLAFCGITLLVLVIGLFALAVGGAVVMTAQLEEERP